jgi:DNA-directed RNA polymerase subunit K/omega
MPQTVTLTKYEYARIVGIRSCQLQMCAPVLVAVPEHLKGNFLYIASKELNEGKLDVIIRRPLPGNKYFEVHLKDCDIPSENMGLQEMLNS